MPPPMIALDIAVSSQVYARLRELAARAGMKPGRYVQLLFDMAYAAKAGAGVVDIDIDRVVAAVGLTLELDEGDIAEALGCSLELVRRIRRAWVETFSRAA